MRAEQKDLYRNVTAETYQTLRSLGCIRIKPDIIAKIERGEELYMEDRIMEDRMEQVEEKLPAESAIEKPDIESRIKEGKPVFITIPVDEECKSSDVYVISDNTLTVKQEIKEEMIPLPHRGTFSQDVYVISDNTSPIKQETEPEMIPVPQRKTFSQGSVSTKPTIIVNIDDDDEDDEDDDDDEEEECYENKQLTCKGGENSADYLVQDVVTPAETKSAPNQNGQNGPVNVWFVKSMKVGNQNPPKGENLNKSSYVVEQKPGGVSIKSEKKDGGNILNSSVPQQTFRNSSGFLENQAHHNRQGSKFGAHDEITIEDDLIDEMEEKIQVCPECSQCFTSLSELEEHMKSHQEESSWICADCGKSYYTKSSLDRHQLTHMRAKPLKCPDCGKGFSKQVFFEMHLRLHAGEVLFPCTECEKLFSSKASCDRHIRAHRMERPHVCPQCGKGFLYNGCLVRHIRVHTGERPFPCPDCGRCFRQTSALNRHIKTHTGEKPYDCSECGKCFTHQSDLNRHRETHRGNQQFVQCVQNSESSLPTYIIL